MAGSAEWPDIPFKAWEPTCRALHLFSQIVGKYRLAHTPWVNHSWHATFYVNSDGLTSGLVPDGLGITLQFDLQRQRLIGSSADGRSDEFALEPMSVAAFNARFKELIAHLGGSPHYHGCPNEVPEVTPFAEDTADRPWDADAVSRFHQALVRIDAAFKEFRSGFLGKVSPVHLFWGSFDLAVTRFSGRSAPRHPGGITNLPDSVTREAYSHELARPVFGREEEASMNHAFTHMLIPPRMGFPISR